MPSITQAQMYFFGMYSGPLSLLATLPHFWELVHATQKEVSRVCFTGGVSGVAWRLCRHNLSCTKTILDRLKGILVSELECFYSLNCSLRFRILRQLGGGIGVFFFFRYVQFNFISGLQYACDGSKLYAFKGWKNKVANCQFKSFTLKIP